MGIAVKHGRFFDEWRRPEHFGSLRKQETVVAIEDVLLFLASDPFITDIRQASYVLATIHHETAATWTPLDEYGRGKGFEYGQPCVVSRGRSVVYYGRGFVQLTWLANYMRASRELGIDLVTDPDRAKEPPVAWKIISAGMRLGWFTGKKLSDYIADSACDYRNARRIVNGTDKADHIAVHARKLEVILEAAR